MTSQRVRVHAIEFRSRANGPGSRAVVWFQGCSLGCAGCFNPETHDSHETDSDVATLLRDLTAGDSHSDGLTVTGGEPLQQPAALAELVDEWKTTTHTPVIVLTGYSWDEIQGDPAKARAIEGADLVIAGRYNERLRIASGLRGSGNKTYHFLTDAYCLSDMQDVPQLEVIIAPDGTLHVTGVAGSSWLRGEESP